MSPLAGLKNLSSIYLFPRLAPWAIPLCGTARRLTGFWATSKLKLAPMGRWPGPAGRDSSPLRGSDPLRFDLFFRILNLHLLAGFSKSRPFRVELVFGFSPWVNKEGSQPGNSSPL